MMGVKAACVVSYTSRRGKAAENRLISCVWSAIEIFSMMKTENYYAFNSVIIKGDLDQYIFSRIEGVRDWLEYIQVRIRGEKLK